MPVAWYFAPYARRDPRPGIPGRYCVMDDFTTKIVADGGAWSECECLGNYAVVKVRASQATLDEIASTSGIRRIPLGALDNTLDSLSMQQRRQLRTFLGNLGYTADEITARFGSGSDLRGFTVGDVLRFALTRRKRSRYDAATDEIVLDGPDDPCRPIEDADAEVGS